MDNAITQRTPLRIFLTGATNPLGLALIASLTAAGHKVIGVTPTADGATRIRQLGGLPVYVDAGRASELASNLRLAKADVVVNAAPQAANQIPVQGSNWGAESLAGNTGALAAAAAATGVRFLLHTSYAFAVGNTGGAVVDETARPQAGDHALLKAAIKAERAALGGGLPAGVLRLGFLYGPGSGVLAALADMLRGGRSVVAGDGLANWLHLADAAEALRRAVEAQLPGEVFNIADGHPISTTGFVEAFARALGVQTPGSVPGFARRLLLPPVQSELMALSTQVSIAKAFEKLGWAPQYNTVALGLEQTLLHWRAASA